jgi:hypothetical protein
MVGALIAALRPIIAVALVGGAATAIVAPAFDMAAQQRGSQAHSAGAAPLRNHPEQTPNPDEDPNAEPEMNFETLLRMCLDTREPDSDDCAAAAEKSGLSYEDFRAKIVAKLEGDKPKAEVKKNDGDFWAVFEKCLDTRDWRSDLCVRAQELIGFNDEDFHAKFDRYLAERDAKNKPEPVVVKKPEPVKQPEVKKPEPKNDFGTWFEKCLATRNFDSDECIRAEELSGLSTADFEAKFKAKLAAKDGSDFWTVFEKCLATRDWRSDTCFRAQELIGFNDADFHAKFDRYLAERDAKTPTFATPKPTPKPTTNPYALFVSCGMTHEWNSKSCLEALARSGLSQGEFRAKMTFTFGEFH